MAVSSALLTGLRIGYIICSSAFSYLKRAWFFCILKAIKSVFYSLGVSVTGSVF